MADEAYTQSLRKFLKTVGVTTQQEIEAALAKKAGEGGPIAIEAVIEAPALDLRRVVKGELTPDRD